MIEPPDLRFCFFKTNVYRPSKGACSGLLEAAVSDSRQWARAGGHATGISRQSVVERYDLPA